jgi:hypothetical protein
MAKFFDSLTDDLQSFIEAQPMFFVATAATEGRVNLSPKGMDSFRCLGSNAVAYLDSTGSGNETAAHLRHDGRITVMFCGFGGRPLIVRLYGTGRAIRPCDPEWTDYADRFPDRPGIRQIVVIAVDSVQSSCGFGVPEMEFKAQRTLLPDWASKKGEDGMAEYRRTRNALSIDGLPTGVLDGVE